MSRRQAALDYHEFPKPGKIGIEVTKSVDSDEDLALAYTPGVASPVLEIADNPENAYKYTAKGNLVAVITDGSAVLGLGNVGALAGKPVMEGKGVLFKKFADIDVFDIEVDVSSSQAFIETVVAIAPTFGGINLEDIAAPACFDIERALIDQLDIPVFHDDQHGTAIIIAAGLLNALHLQGKTIDDVKIVCLGAGAAATPSMCLLTSLGARKSHITMLDSQGVVHTGRDNLNIYKREFAIDTDARTLADAMVDADVFIGVAKPNLVSKEILASMADKPVVFALSNPEPEIRPEVAKAVRDDLIMATGRSDYPNQVNNVLCFPFIFRGALDVRAHMFNLSMQLAAVYALRDLAREDVPQSVLDAYGSNDMSFGSEYILPKPLDPRLVDVVSAAVAKAAVDSGAADAELPEKYRKILAD
ncbi:MAG: malate dehydrogenase [Methylococcales bacterium]|nr:malate dehydrogenase [Methylococcales bacterium]